MTVALCGIAALLLLVTFAVMVERSVRLTGHAGTSRLNDELMALKAQWVKMEEMQSKALASQSRVYSKAKVALKALIRQLEVEIQLRESSPADRLRSWASLVPNYHNVWHAHDLAFADHRGGKLNSFGQDLLRNQGSQSDIWRAICNLDSDGDGLSNGEELGDPCCRWKPGQEGTFNLQMGNEYRRWRLSSPGERTICVGRESFAVDQGGCESYAAGQKNHDGCEQDSNALNACYECGSCMQVTFELLPSSTASSLSPTEEFNALYSFEECGQKCLLLNAFAFQYGKGQRAGDCACIQNQSSTILRSSVWDMYRLHRIRQSFESNVKPVNCTVYSQEQYEDQYQNFYFGRTKRPFEEVPVHPVKFVSLMLFLVAVVHWVMFKGLLHDAFPLLSSRSHLSGFQSFSVCAASFLYMDLASGISHLILDFMPHWLPGLGELARGFQYHHHDPAAITRISWYAYASHVHLFFPLILVMVWASDGSNAQRLFWTWGAVFSQLFQSAHRWAHMKAEEMPWIVKAARESGFLISQEYHMAHHEDFGRQFSILSGHSDVFLDALTLWVPPARYDMWMFLGVGLFLLPPVFDLALRKIHRPKID